MSADWIEVQHQTFTSWVNVHLKEAGFVGVKDLTSGFVDGTNLVHLIDCLKLKDKYSTSTAATGQPSLAAKMNKKPKITVQMLENINLAFTGLGEINMTGITPEEINKGNLKTCLALVWRLILFFQMSSIRQQSDSDNKKSEPSSLEKTILDWVREVIKDYMSDFNFTIDDLSESWKDGKALGALVDKLLEGKEKKQGIPNTFDYEKEVIGSTDPLLQVHENLLNCASENLNIPAIVSAEALERGPEKLSMMTYLSYYMKKGGELLTKDEEAEEEKPTPQDTSELEQVQKLLSQALNDPNFVKMLSPQEVQQLTTDLDRANELLAMNSEDRTQQDIDLAADQGKLDLDNLSKRVEATVNALKHLEEARSEHFDNLSPEKQEAFDNISSELKEVLGAFSPVDKVQDAVKTFDEKLEKLLEQADSQEDNQVDDQVDNQEENQEDNKNDLREYAEMVCKQVENDEAATEQDKQDVRNAKKQHVDEFLDKQPKPTTTQCASQKDKFDQAAQVVQIPLDHRRRLLTKKNKLRSLMNGEESQDDTPYDYSNYGKDEVKPDPKQVISDMSPVEKKDLEECLNHVEEFLKEGSRDLKEIRKEEQDMDDHLKKANIRDHLKRDAQNLLQKLEKVRLVPYESLVDQIENEKPQENSKEEQDDSKLTMITPYYKKRLEEACQNAIEFSDSPQPKTLVQTQDARDEFDYKTKEFERLEDANSRHYLKEYAEKMNALVQADNFTQPEEKSEAQQHVQVDVYDFLDQSPKVTEEQCQEQKEKFDTVVLPLVLPIRARNELNEKATNYKELVEEARKETRDESEATLDDSATPKEIIAQMDENLRAILQDACETAQEYCNSSPKNVEEINAEKKKLDDLLVIIQKKNKLKKDAQQLKDEQDKNPESKSVNLDKAAQDALEFCNSDAPHTLEQVLKAVEDFEKAVREESSNDLREHAKKVQDLVNSDDFTSEDDNQAVQDATNEHVEKFLENHPNPCLKECQTQKDKFDLQVKPIVEPIPARHELDDKAKQYKELCSSAESGDEGVAKLIGELPQGSKQELVKACEKAQEYCENSPKNLDEIESEKKKLDDFLNLLVQLSELQSKADDIHDLIAHPSTSNAEVNSPANLEDILSKKGDERKQLLSPLVSALDEDCKDKLDQACKEALALEKNLEKTTPDQIKQADDKINQELERAILASELRNAAESLLERLEDPTDPVCSELSERDSDKLNDAANDALEMLENDKPASLEELKKAKEALDQKLKGLKDKDSKASLDELKKHAEKVQDQINDDKFTTKQDEKEVDQIVDSLIDDFIAEHPNATAEECQQQKSLFDEKVKPYLEPVQARNQLEEKADDILDRLDDSSDDLFSNTPKTEKDLIKKACKDAEKFLKDGPKDIPIIKEEESKLDDLLKHAQDRNDLECLADDILERLEDDEDPLCQLPETEKNKLREQAEKAKEKANSKEIEPLHDDLENLQDMLNSLDPEPYKFEDDKLTPPKHGKGAFIVACDSFNPITNAHLRLFEIAGDYVKNKLKFEVVGGFVSPVNVGKQKTTDVLKTKHRSKMCKIGVSGSKWVQVDKWQLKQVTGCTTLKTMQHYSEQAQELEKDGKTKMRVFLMCDSDFLEQICKYQSTRGAEIEELLANYGVLCIEKKGIKVSQILSKHERLQKHKKNIYTVPEQITNEVNCEQLRNMVKKGLSIKYLVGPEVEKYIEENKLYK